MQSMEIIIQGALKVHNINNIELAKLAGFNENEIKLLDIYWDSAFNQSWILLSSEIIHEHLGYKKTSSSMANFYIKMKEVYRDNIDYKEVDKNNDIVKIYLLKKVGKETRGGALKKYFIITGETLKKMGMRANTKKGDEMCDYLLKVERLAAMMSKYLMEKICLEKTQELESNKQLLESKTQQLENKTQLLESKTQELERHKSCNIVLKNYVNNVKQRLRRQIILIDQILCQSK